MKFIETLEYERFFLNLLLDEFERGMNMFVNEF